MAMNGHLIYLYCMDTHSSCIIETQRLNTREKNILSSCSRTQWCQEKTNRNKLRYSETTEALVVKVFKLA